jgi:hypothetical protein
MFHILTQWQTNDRPPTAEHQPLLTGWQFSRHQGKSTDQQRRVGCSR